MDAVTSDDDQIPKSTVVHAERGRIAASLGSGSNRARIERARARSGPPRVPVDGTPVDRAGGVLAGARAKAVRGRDRRVK
jgi:hypothetical protein